MEIFGDTFIPSELTDTLVRRCPRCVWPQLRRVASHDQHHFLCDSCGHCWFLAHGRLRAVNVLACQGCAARTKHDCLTLLQDEFPRFGTQLVESR
jgi:hypothetical protein